MFMSMCSPARDLSAGYHAWGHSMVVDPMWVNVFFWMTLIRIPFFSRGNVVATAGEDEEIIYANIGMCKINKWKSDN